MLEQPGGFLSFLLLCIPYQHPGPPAVWSYEGTPTKKKNVHPRRYGWMSRVYILKPPPMTFLFLFTLPPQTAFPKTVKSCCVNLTCVPPPPTASRLN